MNRRKLGSTGLKVSEIAFGGVEIGMPYGPHKDKLLSDNEAADLLHNAVEKGINFFDTARGYGRSEEIMGKAFDGMRKKVLICTKCKHLRNTNGQLLENENIADFIENSVKTSLEKLQTDYIDVFLSHTADAEILENEKVIAAFKSIKQRGIAKAIGVSTYGYNDTKKAVESGNWDVVQLAFNLMDQSCRELLPIAKEKGVGVMVRSVLMRGILTDKKFNFHEKLRAIKLQRQKYRELLDEQITSLSDFATKFVLSFPEVSAALVGIDRQEFLDKAVELADGNYMDSEQLAKAESLAWPDPDFLDLSVWDRNGWLK
jgi:aryl-alcohol dehydrogenase-like predicted oxidoreductase